mgnify:CR=1 FL=1
MKLPKVVHIVKKPLKQSTRPNLTLPTITGKVIFKKSPAVGSSYKMESGVWAEFDSAEFMNFLYFSTYNYFEQHLV